LGNWVKLWVPIIIVSLIISITVVSSVSAQAKYSIPAWVKGVAGFWAEDKITDDEFGEGLSFLIDQNIIKIPQMESLKQEVTDLEEKVSELEQENVILRGEKPVITIPKPTSTKHTITILIRSTSPACIDTGSCLDNEKLTIKVGDTVTFKNDATDVHYLTSGTASYGPSGMFNEVLNPQESFDFTFDKVGSYGFFSINYPWVSGEIVVNLN